MAKESKEKADYTPLAHKHNERCERCKYFEIPRECRLVQGEISPKGWCKHFERHT
jgi:hypothetical protein